MTPDQINGLFELTGGIAICFNIVRLYREKQVKGVAWQSMTFFALWAVWNLYFYPVLGQWWSFWGGVFMACALFTWIGQMVYYTRSKRWSFGLGYYQ